MTLILWTSNSKSNSYATLWSKGGPGYISFQCQGLAPSLWVTQYVASRQDSGPTHLQLGRAGSFSQDRGILLIPAVKPSHAGVYTCQLTTLINNQQYKVSRAILLKVQGRWCHHTYHSIMKSSAEERRLRCLILYERNFYCFILKPNYNMYTPGPLLNSVCYLT